MEISLVTKFSRNYGAILQAVALSKTLVSNQNSVSVVNWPKEKLDRINAVTRKGYNPHDIYHNLRTIGKRQRIRESYKRYITFREEHLTFTRPYLNDDEVFREPPESDIYLVGSDQVWNPMIGYSPIFFLDFGSNCTRRYSYAASIGVENLDSYYQSILQEKLSPFSMVSVREKSAQQTLSKLGISSRIDVDPTLLLKPSEWIEISNTAEIKEPYIKEPYILDYSLYKHDTLLESVQKWAKLKTNYKSVSIGTDPSFRYTGDICAWDFGPKEFVGSIAKASFVVTSSYHGTLFSIMLGIPFATVIPQAASHRIIDLLTENGLADRIIRGEGDLSGKLLSCPTANSHLQEMIEESKEYLLQISR